MLLMLVCGALVLIGLAAIVAWGPIGFGPPSPSPERPAGSHESLRRYLWYVTVMVVAGLGAGLLMAGAGGRLAMRLLAATAGDEAQGRLTEADQLVGVITLDGTIGFIVFVGFFFGLISAALYLLIWRLLPRGLLGGALYGIGLLVWFGSVIEPLRPENRDFDIVGPGWVSLLAFGSLVIVHGMLVVALASRFGRSLPLVGRGASTMVWYAPLLLLAPVFPVLLPLILGALAVAGLGRLRGIRESLTSPLAVRIGRGLVVAASLVALPNFARAIADILGRGPAG